MKRAGFFIRTLALAIDLAAYVFLVLAVVVMVRPPQAYGAWIYCIVWLAYSSFELVIGATPGKMLLRLRVTNQDGSPAGGWKLSMRWTTKQSPIILSLLFLMTGAVVVRFLASLMEYLVLIGCLFASTDSRLAWHDEWAQTAVFRRPKASPPRGFAVVQATPPPLPVEALDRPKQIRSK